MKKIFTLAVSLLIAGSAAAAPSGTPMVFPVNSLFGGAAYNRPMTITAANNILYDGANIYGGTFITVPASLTNPVVYLQPNSYLLTLAGITKPIRFTVPVSTNNTMVVPTSGALLFFGTNGIASLSAGANIAIVTNADSSLTISSTGGSGSNGVAYSQGLGIKTNDNTISIDTNVVALTSLLLPAGTFVGAIYGPGVTPGTNLTTGQQTVVISNGTNATHTLYVDANGNNSTAAKGDVRHAWATGAAAAAVATNGDLINFGVGTLTMLSASITNGVSIQGQGPNFTAIDSFNAGVNCTVENITFGQLSTEGSGSNLNLTLNNVVVGTPSLIDCIGGFTMTNCTVTDSKFYGCWDIDAGCTGGLWKNDHIVLSDAAAPSYSVGMHAHQIKLDNTKLTIIGGTVSMTSSQPNGFFSVPQLTNSLIDFEAVVTNVAIRVYGVVFIRNAAVGSPPISFITTAGGNTNMSGYFFDVLNGAPPVLTYFSGTNYWQPVTNNQTAVVFGQVNSKLVYQDVDGTVIAQSADAMHFLKWFEGASDFTFSDEVIAPAFSGNGTGLTGITSANTVTDHSVAFASATNKLVAFNGGYIFVASGDVAITNSTANGLCDLQALGVSNSTASTIMSRWTGPVPRYNGPVTTNAMAIPSGKIGWWFVTRYPGITNVWNNVQQ